MSQEDSNFVKTFASVVIGLVIFSILLATIAAILQRQLAQEVSEARLAAVDERIRPVGAVHTGDATQRDVTQQDATGDAEAEEGAPARGGTAETEAQPDSTEQEAMSGQQVYQEACSACHATGAGGAPRLTEEAWASRIDKGKDTLYQHSIEGFQGDAGVMPAKGGRADLSDEEVRNAVDYMIGQVGGD